MPKHLLYGIVGLLVGALAGFIFANSINRNTGSAGSALFAGAAQPAGDDRGPQASAPGGMQADVAQVLDVAEKEPENFVAQMKAGDMYARIGRFDKAEEFYKRGIALNSTDSRAFVVLANALFDSKKFEEASNYYVKALELNPNDLNARTDLGTTFVERPAADLDRAVAEFEKALAINPKHEPTLFYLGVAQFRRGEKAAAAEALDRLRKANPTSELIARLEQNMESR